MHVERHPAGQLGGLHQAGRARHVSEGVAARGRSPINDDGAAGSDDDVCRMKIAVAQGLAVGQILQRAPSLLFLTFRQVWRKVDSVLDPFSLGDQFGWRFAGVDLGLQFGQLLNGSQQRPGLSLNLLEERNPVDALQDNSEPTINLDQLIAGRHWQTQRVNYPCGAEFSLDFGAGDAPVEQLQDPSFLPGIDVGGKTLADNALLFQANTEDW
jgi:hypothetical protein